jgi:hypothetical protein
MAIQVTCDICKKIIPEEQRDGDKTNIVSLYYVDFSLPKEYKNVCRTCISSIRVIINQLAFGSFSENEQLRDDTFRAYREGGRNYIIQAIKYFRMVTGLGLKESKDICELWREKYNWPR